MLAFARAGLDIRPLAHRFRNAVLRLHEADNRQSFAAAVEALQRMQDALHARLAQTDLAFETFQARVVARLAPIEADGESLRQAQGRLDARLDQRDLAFEQMQARLAAQLEAIEAARLLQQEDAAVLHHRLAAMESQAEQAIFDRRRDDERYAGQMATVGARLHAEAVERDQLHARALMIERLLTGAPQTRLPGVTAAVAGLGSPAVSVILPSYNRAGFVAEAIASVQAQSFGAWELIVVDDGSTDDTEAVVAAFLPDRRISYLHQARAYHAAARNTGIGASTAQLIAYLDSDNLWYPDFLKVAVECLATCPEVDVVYGALVSDEHGLDRRCILWTPFDRQALMASNFIDANVMVHRRHLVALHGGWDTGLARLADWDLALRYTEDRPAAPIAVLAACYRRCDDQRVSDTVPFQPAQVALRRKWFPPAVPARRPRVLYVVWHYPQLSESYVETELLCLLGWDVQIELWCTAAGPAPYPTTLAIHRGSLAEAVAAFRPDVIHMHWLSFGHIVRAELAGCGVPVTLRLHGFDTTKESLADWLAQDWVRFVYAYPHQISQAGLDDARVRPVPAGFDTRLFQPQPGKDRRMVLRTSAALASKDLDLFFQAARALPDHRFVLAAATCHLREEHVLHLQALNAGMGHVVDLRFDVQRDEIAKLVAAAGIYLHTMHPADHPGGTAVGQPLSIVEAMATGCYCLVRDVPELVAMVGEAGAGYADLEQLVRSIAATQGWTDAEWAGMQARAIDRAFAGHADTEVFQPLFTDWMALSDAPHR